MKEVVAVVLVFCIYVALAQECPTFEYGVHDYGTNCASALTCPGTACGPGEACCFTGCSNGNTYCTTEVYPGCPNELLVPLSADCVTDVCADSPCNAQIGSTCTATCRGCVAEYRDSFNNLIPRSTCACPPTAPAVSTCTIAACTGLTCPAVPTAQCRVNSCGGCVPFFYDMNGNRVTDCTLPPVATPCSPNPCLNGGTCTVVGTTFNCTCTDDYKGTTCDKRKRDLLQILLILKFLGGIGQVQNAPPGGGGVLPRSQCPDSCAGLWCPTNRAATCRVTQSTCEAVFYDTNNLPVPTCRCPDGQSPLIECGQDSCRGLQCGGYPTAVCKVSACGSCRFSFYGPDGRGVPCTNY